MTTLQSAKAAGELGQRRAIEHAERVEPGWAERAYGYLGLFAARMSKAPYLEPWSTEEFRTWAHGHGLPYPPDNRSIGGVIARAMREGIISPVGFAPTISSNGSPRRTYRRAR